MIRGPKIPRIRETRPKVPCQCCGKLVRRRPLMNKAKYPHKCPHGRPCAVGTLLYGTHANGPPTAHPMKCHDCPSRADHDAIVAGLGRNPTVEEIEEWRAGVRRFIRRLAVPGETS